MKTAKEYLCELNDIIHYGQRANDPELGSNILRSLLSLQIEGMEEAAKLVCELCRDEGLPKSNQTIHSWHHGESKVSGEADFCYAMDIHDRIAELKKEREALQK